MIDEIPRKSWGERTATELTRYLGLNAGNEPPKLSDSDGPGGGNCGNCSNCGSCGKLTETTDE
jgi:hypothetical protein